MVAQVKCQHYDRQWQKERYSIVQILHCNFPHMYGISQWKHLAGHCWKLDVGQDVTI